MNHMFRAFEVAEVSPHVACVESKLAAIRKCHTCRKPKRVPVNTGIEQLCH